MAKRKFSVFHGLVNYGTQAGFFAKELRNQGTKALSVTGYDRFNRITDITLKNSGKNIFVKLYNAGWNSFFRLKCFFKFDIFHFYFGETLLYKQWDLPFYNWFGKKIIFHYLGFDVQLYQQSIKKYKTTNVAFVFDEEAGAKHDDIISKRLRYETKYADLQLVCAPCYSEFVQGSSVLPLAIDIDEYEFSPMVTDADKIVILHAPTSRNNKGTSFILAAFDRLIQEGYNIEPVLVEHLSHAELKEEYKKCDIFIDQIVSGWYGTASIEAMAIGRPVICSIRESYFEYIDFGKEIPIFNAFPDSIYEVIKNLIINKDRLPEIGLKGRQFVEKYHDVRKLTKDLVNYYQYLY